MNIFSLYIFFLFSFEVLDTNCFERLLGNCVKLLKRGIRNYKFIDAATSLDIENDEYEY